MAGDQNPQQRVMPTLRMTDYARSKQFYVDGLGFQIDWEHRFEPGFPVFAQVSRDGLAFFLTEHTGDCPVGGLAHLYVDDVDAAGAAADPAAAVAAGIDGPVALGRALARVDRMASGARHRQT